MLCEGKKTKTLGRRYPKAALPNVPYSLSTKAFPAKTLGCEGKIEKYFRSNKITSGVFKILFEVFKITSGVFGGLRIKL